MADKTNKNKENEKTKNSHMNQRKKERDKTRGQENRGRKKAREKKERKGMSRWSGVSKDSRLRKG